MKTFIKFKSTSLKRTLACVVTFHWSPLVEGDKQQYVRPIVEQIWNVSIHPLSFIINTTACCLG